MGVKGLQVALVVFQSAHPHPNLPPVRGKGLVVALMQSNLGLLNPLDCAVLHQGYAVLHQGHAAKSRLRCFELKAA